MTGVEFATWRADAVESFAADLAQALGRPLEAARVRAAAQFDEELPDGLATAGHWLFVINDSDGVEVGTVWLGPHPHRPGAGFVYDLVIAERMRRRGFGRAAMLAAEEVLRSAGMTEVGLNVFGFNDSARRLYESIGYDVTSIQMRKAIT